MFERRGVGMRRRLSGALFIVVAVPPSDLVVFLQHSERGWCASGRSRKPVGNYGVRGSGSKSRTYIKGEKERWRGVRGNKRTFLTFRAYG